jgi:hypothetical protein
MLSRHGAAMTRPSCCATTLNGLGKLNTRAAEITSAYFRITVLLLGLGDNLVLSDIQSMVNEAENN